LPVQQALPPLSSYNKPQVPTLISPTPKQLSPPRSPPKKPRPVKHGRKSTSSWMTLIIILSLCLIASLGASVASLGISSTSNREYTAISSTPSVQAVDLTDVQVVYIPAGEFPMGCHPDHNDGYPCPPAELPLHVVYLDAYYIDATPVTNNQYVQCIAAGVCEASSNRAAPYYYGEYPVTWVNWHKAQTYCTWVGKRLPTEAEWEKAARGTTAQAYPWGDRSPDCALANANLCVGSTTEVGSYPIGASPYGALDMAGNVWEWVSDWYSDLYYSESPYANPLGPNAGLSKVIRGGSWAASSTHIRTSHRIHHIPSHEVTPVSFRCAFSPQE
jgi:eukaryotic-like serine/threonine-protein kinase